MVAVSEAGLALPDDLPVLVPGGDGVEGRRIVAVAVSPMELLRPGSDLVRAIAGAGYVDLLLACEDEPVADPRPVCVLGGGAFAVPGSGHTDGDSDGDFDSDSEDDSEDDAVDVTAELHAATAWLGLDELHLHRLALPGPLSAAAEPDLVAALSELVGFDPEPGVHVLAPAPAPGYPQRAVVDRAVRRIVQVYGLPLLHYRCLELAVVEI